MRVGIGLRNEHLGGTGTNARRAAADGPCTIGAMTSIRRPLLGRAFAAITVVALLVAACSPNTPTVTPGPTPTAGPTTGPTATLAPSGTPIDPAAVYAAIEDEVVAIRGLEPEARLDPTVLDEATLKANLTRQFDEDNKPEDVATDERLLRILGLLQPGVSLRDAYLDLQGGQVIGYYSPDDAELFVVSRSGALGPTERATFAHEFTHALQDQHFDLNGLGIDDVSNGDRALARLALVEGDATVTQTEWMLAHLTGDDIAKLIEEASDPEVMAALARAPAILRDTSLFPYQDGAALVNTLRGGGDWAAVNAAFDAPPDSTEQVLHPASFTSREPPVDVSVPDGTAAFGAGWAVSRADTLGELLLRIWLRENGVRGVDAIAASAGWGGDRAVLLEAAGDRFALGLDTTWDRGADADEFAAAARTAIADQAFARVVAPTSRRVVVLLAGDADALARLASLYGVAA
jgi:hypothetical protein